MGNLLGAAPRGTSIAIDRNSNPCASRLFVHHVAESGSCVIVMLIAALLTVATPAAARQSDDVHHNKAATAGLFLLGGAIGLGAHEGGHLLFDYIFDAAPGIRAVDFHGIPFYAITHRTNLSPRRELTIASAGFWMQHAGNEWLLSTRPRLRGERAPLAKGLVAFNVLTSVAYAGAAFARTGPAERDTRGIASTSGFDERWVGAIILAPAVLDSVRYFKPDARWAVWASRAAKVGMVLMVAK
jgi:hypothetical protein